MFSRLSIRAKIVTVVTVTILSSVTTIAGLSVWREAARFADARAAEIKAIAQVLASSAAEPLATNARVEALRALRAIRDFDGVTFARVEYQNGQPLAEIGTGIALERDIEAAGRRDPVAILLGQPLVMSVPVRHGGETIGALILYATTKDVWLRIGTALRDLVVASILAGLFGIIAANLITRRITAPIRRLRDAMSEIGTRQEFDRIVARESDDETGILTDSFNALLAQIRVRDDTLRRHREELEETVERRTRELQIAKNEADRANAAKSDFLATMSHEIRTPMNGMLVSAELLAEANLPRRMRRHAEIVTKSGQGLLSIINDILDFSKIESHQMDLEDAQVDIRDAVTDIVDMFFDKARDGKLELVATVSPSVPETMVADPIRIRQVLSNLVNNAIKFTEKGSVVVSVDHGSQAGWLRFSVTDTGIGIPVERRQAIFESFAQADQSTTRRFGGTGLGLAICQRLVEAMGGTIWVEERVGGGSIFNVEIAPETSGAPPVWAPLPVEKDIHVLVDLDGAETAQSLQDLIRGFLPDAVFSDSATPEASARSLRFCSLDRAARQHTGHTIIVAAAGDDRADTELTRDTCDAVMFLPASPKRLHDAIRAAMGQPMHSDTSRHARTHLPQWPGKTVLTVDDSSVNLEVATYALERLGVSMTSAANGQEAIEYTANDKFDLIFMDCNMPTMDGYSATRTIRSREAGSNSGMRIPIIALTAEIDAATSSRWREAGMDGFLPKPFSLSQLQACLETWLGAPDTREENPVEGTELGLDSAPIIHEKYTDAVPVRVSATEGVQPEHGGVPDETDKPLVDMKTLGALGDLGSEAQGGFLLRLFGLYRDNAPDAISSIETAIRERDLESLRRAAHALKSMSHNIGAARLATMCVSVEGDARTGNTRAFVLAKEIAPCFSASLKCLATIVGSWPPPNRTAVEDHQTHQGP